MSKEQSNQKGSHKRGCPNCGIPQAVWWIDEYDNLICAECELIIGSAEIELKGSYHG